MNWAALSPITSRRRAPLAATPACASLALSRQPITAFGRRAQTELVRQQEARQLAAEHGLFLRGLGGTEDGVIGALSAVGLGASGQDGRFILVGTMRELDGRPTHRRGAGVGDHRRPGHGGTPHHRRTDRHRRKAAPRPARRAPCPLRGAW